MSEVAKPTSLESREPAEFRFERTYYFLIGFYSLAIVWGIRAIYHDRSSALDFVVPVGLATCLGWWAVVDSRRRRKPIPMSARPWFFFLAGVVVPVDLIWSRKWRGAGWVVLHAVLWMILATIAMHTGGIVVYGEAWLRALGI